MSSNREETNDQAEAPKDGPPYIGPVTEAAVGRGGGPTPLNKEWHAVLRNPGEFVFLWAAANKGHGKGDATLSWSWFFCGFGDPPSSTDIDNGEAKGDTPNSPTIPAKTERLLSPLAHESRIRLMQALFKGPKGASDLTEATDLKGGNLYHHLKELIYAAYVKEADGGYALTDLGRQLFLTMTCIASLAVKDEGEKGLCVGGN